MLLWRLAYQNLLTSIVSYGFRVYSQHLAEGGRESIWSALQSRVMDSILSSEIEMEVDEHGRLIVIDGSPTSSPRDSDGDGFKETIELSQADASLIVHGQTEALYRSMKEGLADWNLLPSAGLTNGNVTSPKTYESQTKSTGVAEELITRSDQNKTIIPDEAKEKPTQDDKSTSAAPPAFPKVNSEDGSLQAGLIVRVGETLDGFQSRVHHLNLGHTSLNQLNMGVVGDLGTGKTQLLKSIVYQIAAGESGNRGIKPNVLIFDYKKDYSSEDFVQATGARVIKPQHLPLNLFDLSSSSQSVNPWLDRYRFFADAIDKIYSGIGPVQRDRLKNAIKQAYKGQEDLGYPTIYDVHRNYVDALKGGADSLSGILGDLVDMELFAIDKATILGPDVPPYSVALGFRVRG